MRYFEGIDISHWQGDIDFTKVQPQVDFCILKAGGSDKGLYKDSKFEEYYKYCNALKIPMGAYYFVGKNFTSIADGVADAERFLKIVEGKKFSYPLFLDLEATSPTDKKGATDASIAFCKYVQNHGYYVSIYASEVSGFKDRLDASRLGAFDLWVAKYPVDAVYSNKPKMLRSYGMWQYTSKGRITGISGNVDRDVAFYNYPEIMRKAHLNGF